MKAELDGFLGCGLLCRGFAHLRCADCDERRLVAFSCKGRGFCPSCAGRRMCQTALNLRDHVLPPEVPLRQWVVLATVVILVISRWISGVRPAIDLLPSACSKWGHEKAAA